MSVSWGKVLAGIATVSGVAVAGVGLGGESLSGMFDAGTIKDGVDAATEAVVGAGESAAKTLGLDDTVSGEAMAGIAGGAAALVGAGVLASGKNKEQNESKDERLARVENELAMIKNALLEAMQQSEAQMAQGSLPPVPGRPRQV